MALLHTRLIGSALAVAVGTFAPACGDDRQGERWVTTEDSIIDLDWDAVGTAYREAEGPQDFETRVNEIYAGDDVMSVAVEDLDETTQLVTGFFDRDADGQIGEDEKIFTIRREVVGEDRGQYQIAGHGPYAGYRSPVWDIAAGMFMGSMMARMFTPGVAYATPYVTSPSRRGELVAQQRQAAARSKSGRAYGKKGGAFGGGRSAPPRRMPSRGGGRFGARGNSSGPVLRLLA